MKNLDISKEEQETIAAIVTRIIEYCCGFGEGYCGPDKLTLEMNLVACHLNGCPLRLDDLRTAHMRDLEHDVMGIHKHINRKTGKLENFKPRYAQNQ